MTVDQLERPIVTKGLVNPTTVMATPMLGEVFLLDMARQGHLVGGRARTCSTEVGERLLESLSDHVREELIRYLKSYESKPAVLESEWGPVMILPYLMPAGCLLIFCCTMFFHCIFISSHLLAFFCILNLLPSIIN